MASQHGAQASTSPRAGGTKSEAGPGPRPAKALERSPGTELGAAPDRRAEPVRAPDAERDWRELPLEELLYVRLGDFLERLDGGAVPELYKTLQDQLDRAVLRQALERTGGRLGAAATLLGLDRNTLARKVKRLDLTSGANPAKQAPLWTSTSGPSRKR